MAGRRDSGGVWRAEHGLAEAFPDLVDVTRDDFETMPFLLAHMGFQNVCGGRAGRYVADTKTIVWNGRSHLRCMK